MAAAPRTPPRFVPTLTEVVQAPPGVPAHEAAPAIPAEPEALAVSTGLLQEQIIQRVMQRVDLSLERRLQEAVAAVIAERTRSLVPMLREEIESVVRRCVGEAVAEELSGHDDKPQRGL